jgi:hypothetical protein
MKDKITKELKKKSGIKSEVKMSKNMKRNLSLPFLYMEKGDSFIFDIYTPEIMDSAQSSIDFFCYRNAGCKFSFRKINGHLRIWKTKGEKTSLEINPTKYIIDKNIPFSTKTTCIVYPFGYMAVGDSFIYDDYSRGKMQFVANASRAYIKSQQPDWKFTSRKIDGKIRVWKTKGEKQNLAQNPTQYKIEKDVEIPTGRAPHSKKTKPLLGVIVLATSVITGILPKTTRKKKE